MAQPTAYVASQGAITVVNVVNNGVIASIPVSGSAAGLAVTPNGAYLYVALSDTDNVAVISTNTNSLVNTISVGSGPVQIAITPTGSAAYVANQKSNNVSVINLATNTVMATIPVGTRPAGVTITPDGSEALITNLYTSNITIISTSTNTVTGTCQSRQGARTVAVTPNGSTLYVLNQYYNTVAVQNMGTGITVSTISGFAFPDSVVVTPDGSQLYVSNGKGKSVSVISTATNTVTATIPVGNTPYDLAISPDGSTVYAVNMGDGTVSVINAATNTVTATISGMGTTPVAIAVSGVASGGVTVPTMPVLPQSAVDTAYPVVTGQSIAVNTGGDFQGALNSANCGDEIVLEAGATFSGNFNVPAKTCTGKILVRSSQIASLPQGVRVQQTQTSLMPTVITPNSMSVLSFMNTASGYYFAGINFTVANGIQGMWNLITLSVNATATSQLPHNIVFDRVLVHGNDQMCVRGFLADAVGFGLLNSQVYDFIHNSQDTQAVLAYNSPGPFLLYNNYLEATGENVMFGGADPTIANVIPSDVTVQRNYLNKLYSAWNNQPQPGPFYDVKNTFEIKNGQRMLLDSNVFSYSWGQGQGGDFVVLTPRAQCYNFTSPPPVGYCNAPWATASDITVTNNLFQHAGGMLYGYGLDTDTPPGLNIVTQSARVLFRNNLGWDLNGQTYAGGGQLGAWTETINWTVDHNTSLNTMAGSAGLFLEDPPPGDPVPGPSLNPNMIVTNNILYGQLGASGDNPLMAYQQLPASANVSYDVWVSGTMTGFPSSAFFFEPVSHSTPVPGQPACNQGYPPAACIPLNWALVGFVDYAGGSVGTDLAGLALAPTSPYHNAASDGTDFGANVASVLFATNGVAQ
jgi:YVTN family beta-propeller protein